ncbi:MAG: aspartyl protease family protein [Bacteroidales bacterium]|nr:aspartyl protease family protein [Bacteroidales bacterium]
MSGINIQRYAFTSVNPTYNREIVTLAEVSKPSKNNDLLQFTQYRALWDTGATNSVVTPKIVKELNLIPIGVTKTTHAGGHSEVNVFQISIRLPNNIIIPNVLVSECADQAGRFDLIVGMDIISLGDFAITGQGNQRMVSFCLPSMMMIDYVPIAAQFNSGIK